MHTLESAMSAEQPVRNAASFRDPAGFVFELEGRIYRAVNEPCLALLRELNECGLLPELVRDGLVVPTSFVEDPAVQARLGERVGGDWAGFLEHERISPISFPCEWSASMLADAGILTLDLQMRLLARGYSLKDATAYNIQFHGGRPVFIDLPSIERPARLDVWHALGQFGRMFTLPLLLSACKGQSLRSYFLANLDGCDVSEVRRAFGRLELLRPGLLLDLTLPYWLGRMADSGRGRRPGTSGRTAGTATPQLANLKRLRAKLGRLAKAHRPGDVWADYTSTCSYSRAAEDSKVAMVRDFLAQAAPATVLDVGCNTGAYSRLAAQAGAAVVAIDNSTDSIELFYRSLRQDPLDILPLVVDLANPSPPMGFRHRERPGFMERVKADCVLALAVIHHLHVSANLPVEGIRDLFADLAGRHLVLEFVPTDDVMFKRLLRFREDLYAGFTVEACIAAFAPRFRLLRREPVADSPRTLLFFERI